MEVKLINSKDHQEMIVQVVESLKQVEDDLKVTFITKDGQITSQPSSFLRTLSSVFRDLLSGITFLPGQQAFIIIQDFSSRSVSLFMHLLNNQGVIREPLTIAEIEEVVELAAIFNIKLSKERDVVPVVPIKTEINPKPNVIENIKSNSILDVKQEKEEVVIEDVLATNMKYSCKMCPTESASNQKLKLHYAHKHYSKWLITEAIKYDAGNKTCKLCNKSFKTGQQFNLHIGLKHRIMDEILGKEDQSLTSHGNRDGQSPRSEDELSKVNNNDKKGQNCQLCPKTSRGLGALYQHYSNAHLSKEIARNFPDLADFQKFQCLLCGKKFRQKNGLIIHLGSNHLLVNSLLAQRGLEELEVRAFKTERNAGGGFIVECQSSPVPVQEENIPYQELQLPLPELNNYYLNAFDLNVLTE